MQTRKLDLVSMYLSQPVMHAHSISLQLAEVKPGHMTGTIRLDPNTCSLDLWGDRGGCTKMAPQNQSVEATAMRTLDPQGHHRVSWKLEIPGMSAARVSLVEYPSAKLWYLSVATETEGSSVVPLFDTALFARSAAGSGEQALHDVTEYHLHGDGAEIAFHGGSDDEMKLEYNGKVFSGRALYRETTVLGFAASAILETIPDLRTVWITVMIPHVRCPANAESTAVSTFAVLTTKRTSIAGPAAVSGQGELYKVVALTGHAW